MKPLAPGMLVVAHSITGIFEHLNGQVGEIKAADYSWFGDWEVFFPQQKGLPCPGCGLHPDTGVYPVFSRNLKPLDDPDQGIEETHEETIDDLVTA